MQEFTKLLLSGITHTEAINEMGQKMQKSAPLVRINDCQSRAAS